MVKTLTDAWFCAAKPPDALAEKIFTANIDAIKQNAADILMRCAGVEGIGFPVFNCYSALVEDYYSISKMYNEKRTLVTNENLKKLLNGICTVILSRLTLTQEKQIGLKKGENPVSEENKEIFQKEYNEFVKAADTVTKEFKQKYFKLFRQSTRESFIKNRSLDEVVKLSQNVPVVFAEYYGKEMFSLFDTAVKLIRMNLNDWSGRKQLSYYSEILPKEKSILDDLTQNQLPALLALVKEGVSEEEKQIIDIFCTGITKMQTDIARSEECLRPKPFRAVQETEETFINSLHSIKTIPISEQSFTASCEGFFKLYPAFICALEKLMTEKAKKIIESDPATKKRKYKLKQTEFENITLANEIRAAFVDANAYFSANEMSLLSCNSAEIIKGVDETIKIKIEALKEATDLFSTESEQTITMFEPASVLLTNDEVLIKSYADEIAFSLCPYSSGQEADSITNRTFNEVFGLFMQDKAVQAEKYAEKFAEKLLKQTIKFKKEHLLYEISAFEEIMCYSISRVKQDTSEAAIGYAVAAERCFSDISLCLLKSGIEIIRPNSGDRFNGKEHEVLMAEKNPDFAKGEIIKTMNSGYKQGDITLIRANVIAAR